MTKLTLESNLSGQQKIHIATFIALGGLMIFKLSAQSLSVEGFVILGIVVAVTAMSVVLFFSKKGLLEKNKTIYNAIFLHRTVVFKSKVELKDVTACSILRFRKSQKFAFFSAARPDLANEFKAFDIYLLNQKHTKKAKLFTLRKEKNSKLAIDFLIAHGKLKFEVYSPDFS